MHRHGLAEALANVFEADDGLGHGWIGKFDCDHK
jgi:hypothetical protein